MRCLLSYYIIIQRKRYINNNIRIFGESIINTFFVKYQCQIYQMLVEVRVNLTCSLTNCSFSAAKAFSDLSVFSFFLDSVFFEAMFNFFLRWNQLYKCSIESRHSLSHTHTPEINLSRQQVTHRVSSHASSSFTQSEIVFQCQPSQWQHVKTFIVLLIVLRLCKYTVFQCLLKRLMVLLWELHCISAVKHNDLDWSHITVHYLWNQTG